MTDQTLIARLEQALHGRMLTEAPTWELWAGKIAMPLLREALDALRTPAPQENDPPERGVDLHATTSQPSVSVIGSGLESGRVTAGETASHSPASSISEAQTDEQEEDA